MSENRRVVVTGLGAVTPLGNNVNETWENLKNGKNGIAPITLFDTEGMVIVQLGAVDAVAAAFLDLFAEQHSVSSLSSFSLIIHQPLRYFYSYFCKLRTKMQRLPRSEGRKGR